MEEREDKKEERDVKDEEEDGKCCLRYRIIFRDQSLKLARGVQFKKKLHVFISPKNCFGLFRNLIFNFVLRVK